MKLYTWHCPDAPENHRYVSRMLVRGGFLPVVSNAATAKDAEQKLRDIWITEGEVKLRKRGQLHPAEDKGVESDPLGEVLG